MCSAMSHKPDPQPSQPPRVRAEVDHMHAGATPAAPLASVLGDVCGRVVALVSGERGDGQGGRAGGYRATEGGRSRGGEGRGGGQGRTGGGGKGRG